MKNRRIFKIGAYVGIALLGCVLGLCWMLKNVDRLPVAA